MYYPSPDYLKRATNSCVKLTEETGYINAGMNISGTMNLVIQNVGRFAESYAGDILIDVSHVYAMVNKHRVEPQGENVAIGIGIRKNGVDHNAYIMNRLAETARANSLNYPLVEKDYRKVLVILIDILPKPAINDALCTVRLYDVTDHLGRMTEEDMAWNPDEDVEAHYADRPECAGEEWNHYASYLQEIIQQSQKG